MNFNPLTLFGLLDARVAPETEQRVNGGSRTNGANQSGRATLLTMPQQATVDAPCGVLEDEATVAMREEREAAQARMASTSIELNGSLDDLIAQQAREAKARE